MRKVKANASSRCAVRTSTGWLTVLLLSLLASSAQATNFSAFESFARVSRNSNNKPEGLFTVSYIPIPPAAVGTQTYRFARPTAEAAIFNYRDLAEQFIIQNQELLDVASAGDLKYLRETVDSAGGRHLRFARTYRGILLDDMEVIVHFNADTNVTGINGQIVRLPADLRQAIDKHLISGGTVIDADIAASAVAESEGRAVSSLKITDPQVLITTESPYVVWELQVALSMVDSYTYRVSDEQPPRILSKVSNLKH